MEARSAACAAATPMAMHGPITRALESAAGSASVQRPMARRLVNSGESKER